MSKKKPPHEIAKELAGAMEDVASERAAIQARVAAGMSSMQGAITTAILSKTAHLGRPGGDALQTIIASSALATDHVVDSLKTLAAKERPSDPDLELAILLEKNVATVADQLSDRIAGGMQLARQKRLGGYRRK
jgi:hypothetical protein